MTTTPRIHPDHGELRPDSSEGMQDLWAAARDIEARYPLPGTRVIPTRAIAVPEQLRAPLSPQDEQAVFETFLRREEPPIVVERGTLRLVGGYRWLAGAARAVRDHLRVIEVEPEEAVAAAPTAHESTAAVLPLPTDLSAYRFAEVVEGGANHRGRVLDLTTWTPRRGGVDDYVSALRFTSHLQAYAAGHTSRSGRNPSVEDYDGPALTPGVWYDLDSESPAEALREADVILTALRERYDLDTAAVEPAFTGSKGISLFLPAALFGGFTPGTTKAVARHIKRLALALVNGLNLCTLDTTVYDGGRILRVENTRNSKSGCYKVPLTTHEVLTLSIAEIQAIAAQRRELVRPDRDDWLPNPDLVALKNTTAADPEAVPRVFRLSDSEIPATMPSQENWNAAVKLLADNWPAAGKRHPAELALMGGLARANYTEDQAHAFGVAVVLEAMGEEAEERTKTGEWERAAKTTFAKYGEGEAITGWTTLAGFVGRGVVDEAQWLLGLTARVIIEDAATESDDGTPCSDLRRRVAELEEINAVQCRRIQELEGQVTAYRERDLARAAMRSNRAFKLAEKGVAEAIIERASARPPDTDGWVDINMQDTARDIGIKPPMLSIVTKRLKTLGAIEKRTTSRERVAIVDKDGNPKIDGRTGLPRTRPIPIVQIRLPGNATDAYRQLGTLEVPEHKRAEATDLGRKQRRCPDHPEAGTRIDEHCRECNTVLESKDGTPAAVGYEPPTRPNFGFRHVNTLLTPANSDPDLGIRNSGAVQEPAQLLPRDKPRYGPVRHCEVCERELQPSERKGTCWECLEREYGPLAAMAAAGGGG